jgi:protein involved in polysaccharide export with SLBB domain
MRVATRLQFLFIIVLVFLVSAGSSIARAQSGLDPSLGSGQSSAGDCEDSNSATCVPSNNSSTQPMAGGQGFGPAMAAPNSGSGLNQPYATANEPLAQPDYRDESALPNQTRSAIPGYRPVPPEPLTEFQKFVAETTGQVLPIFGARLFRQVPTTFSPVDQIPVPANAVVGPGDLLRIRVWGRINFSADVRVDRSGEVYIPQVGPVHVAGLQYSELDTQLHIAIARVYRSFSVSAQIGQVRSIQIFVVGHARRPGTYTISSLSSLVDAVFASGGPGLDGSLRHVELKRNGKVITDFDLYDLLVNGDKSHDARLEPGDVVYFPVVGPQVAVVGSAKTQAIYELKEHESLGELLDEAGGISNVASSGKLSLESMQATEGRAMREVPATPEGLATLLRSGDIVRVAAADPRYENTVTLRGNTANAGRYGWHAGMRLSDLFPERAALLTRNYWWQRTRMGLASPEFDRIPSLEGLTQPSEPETLPLSPEDRIRENRQRFLQRQALLQNRSARTQPSQANNPGSGIALPAAASLGDQTWGESLGYASGEPSDEAGFSTNTYSDAGVQSYPQDSGQDQQDYGQSSGQTPASAERNVQTENTANAQGKTSVTLPAPEIDWKYAVIERLNPATLTTSLVPFDLGRLVMDHDSSQDLALQPGDVVTVFSQADIHVPVEQQTRIVRLEGEFVHAGIYSVQPGETLQALVERAGGLAPGAYLFGSEFTRASVRAVQQRRLDDYVQNLQLQIERGVLATSSAVSSSASDLASASVAGTEARELVARLRQIRATGRIVLSLRAYSEGALALPAIGLQDGDAFYVPPVPTSISVIGAVYDQNSFIFSAKQHVQYYIQLAGGVNKNADKKHPFVIRADGSVISQDQVGEKNFNKIIIQPGDTIVVSEKSFGPTKLRSILDFSQLFAQLAVGSAVLGTVL